MDAGDFLGHALGLICANADFYLGMDARRAHGVQGFVAAADGIKNSISFAFDVHPVCVEFYLQACLEQAALTGGDIFREGNSNPE
jgi:hypothetical protein